MTKLRKRTFILVMALFAMSLSSYAIKVNLNFFVNGGKVYTQSVEAGGTYVISEQIPEDTIRSWFDCRDYHFVGWKLGSPVKGNETPSLPTLVTPIANVNLHAVFNKDKVNRYERITTVEELEADNEYLIVSCRTFGGENRYYAMNGITGTYAYDGSQSWGKLGAEIVVPQNGFITNPGESCVWTFSATSTPGMYRISIGNNGLYVGNNHKYWMLNNPASSGTKNIITAINGEFRIKTELQEITKHKEETILDDYLYIKRDTTYNIDTTIFDNDTIVTVDTIVSDKEDTIEVKKEIIIPAYNDTSINSYYLKYVDEDITTHESFFITGREMNDYPLYLYKKESSYTSSPDCDKWTTHLDAVEGAIGAPDGPKTMDMKELYATWGLWRQDPAESGLPKAYMPTGSCEGWDFAGWALESPVQPTTIRPTMRSAGQEEQMYNGEKLYAVYAKGIYYERVKSVNELNDGDVCVIVDDKQSNAAVTYSGDKYRWASTIVDIENDTIKNSVAATMEWTYRKYDQTFWNGIHPLAYAEDVNKYAYKIDDASAYSGDAEKFWMWYSQKETTKHWLTLEYKTTKKQHWLTYEYEDGSIWKGFCDEQREDKGNKQAYWEYNVFRQDGSNYTKVSNISDLNDGDNLVLVLVDPWASSAKYALGNLAVTRYSGYNYWWDKPQVTISGDCITSAVDGKSIWTYRASDSTLWNGSHVLGEEENLEQAFKLAASTETKHESAMSAMTGEDGRFWLRYEKETILSTETDFRHEKDESIGWKKSYWEYEVYRKNGSDYEKVSHSADLKNGDVLVLVLVNKYNEPAPIAVTRVSGQNKRWAVTYVTISGDKITSSVSDKMEWTYNASDSTLWNGTHILSHKEDTTNPFKLAESTESAASDLKQSGVSGRFWLRADIVTKTNAYWLSYNQAKNRFCDKSEITDGTVNDYWQYRIYRKAGTAQYSSYPHCAPYKVTLHACGGTFSDGTTTVVKTETSNGAGIILPTCNPNCTAEGWEFVGWFQGESKNAFEKVEFHDYIAAGTRFIPTNDGVELFALYKKTTDKFLIVRGGPSKIVPGEGEDYLITFYTTVNGDNKDGNTKYYDYEISGQTKYTKLDRNSYNFCVGKRGESPQNGEDFYMIESDSINMWRFIHVNGEIWNLQNVKTGQYLKLGTSGSSARCEMVNSPYELHILDAGKGFEVNICRLDNKKYYAMYCHTSGVYTTSARQWDGKRNLYSRFSYVYRRVKEFSSWPHCEKFSVHFDACGGTCDVKDLTETVSYGGVVAPEGHASVECAKLGWQFAGWLRRPLNDEIDELTFDLVPGGSTYHPISTSDTLYAVYQQKTDKYKRVKGISSLYLGGRYIVATAPNAKKPNMALSNTADNEGNPRYVTATEISPAGDTVIINENQALDWTLKGQWGEYVFYNSNRNVYLSMKEPSLAQLTPDEQDQVDITFDVEGDKGYTFRSVQNITHNDGGNKFLTYSSSYFRTAPSTTVEPLAMYRQQCYYISFPICHQEVDALYWEKADNGDVHVTVESYLLKKTPDMHNSMGSPEPLGDGTYRILLNSDLLPPCSRSLITWHGATAELRVPFIVNKDITSSEILGTKDCDTCDVYVMDGNTLTIDEDRTVRIMTLHNGAKLNVQDGKRLRVQQLVLFADGDRISPEVNLNSTGTVVLKNGELYYDRRVDENRWYWLTLPFDADVREVTYANEQANGGAPAYYRNFWIKYYDGAQRAQDVNNYGSNGLQDTYWTGLANPGGKNIMNAGQGYQFGIADQKKIVQKDGLTHTKRVMRFTMHPNGYSWNNIERGFDKTAPIIASTVNDDRYASEAGWNLVGNPYMRSYNTGFVSGASGLVNGAWIQEFNPQGEWTGFWILNENLDTTVPYLTIYNPGTRQYSQVLASNYTMRPAEAVFVQVGTGNRINFSGNFTVKAPRHSARRYEEPLGRLFTGVQIEGNGQEDRTAVVLSDEFTADYEIGGDLIKTNNNGKLNLYTINANSSALAFNAMSDQDAQRPIPMGVTVPAEGTYTFSFDAEQYDINAVDTVTLIDYVEGTRTNLLRSDYTFSAQAGRNDKRFALLVHRASQESKITTGVDNVDANSSNSANGAHKYIKDGVLYITRDGKTYDIIGSQVK